MSENDVPQLEPDKVFTGMPDAQVEWVRKRIREFNEDVQEIVKYAERVNEHYEELVDALGEGYPGQKHHEIIEKVKNDV